jgi:NAD(P)-dependent dehydrogenase (short-subunit alcohol dehydrogenase family)
VTICGRRKELLELATAAARQHDHRPSSPMSPTKRSMTKLHQHAQSAYGGFDIVVANAGGAESAPAEKVSAELWNKTLNLNLTGAFFTVKPALAAMRERGWGRIVFIASTAGLKAYAYVAPYVAAKHGVVGLARALALETAKNGITVNAVCPGFTETPLIEQAVAASSARPAGREADARSVLAAHNPQGASSRRKRWPTWCCGSADGSASITGQAISVSGGETW